ncbi:MAG: hypothetical protein Q7J51_05505 [Sheuella sp.]|nr:hypothetical protein [Sheuella sp.]
MSDSERLRKSFVALSDAQQIEQTILDGIEAHVYLKSAELRYLYANRQMIESLNLSRDQETTVTLDGRTLHFWSTKMLLRRAGKEDCLLG